jgi:hypothetical protein
LCSALVLSPSCLQSTTSIEPIGCGGKCRSVIPSHSKSHAHRHRRRPGSTPNHGQSHSHSSGLDLSRRRRARPVSLRRSPSGRLRAVDGPPSSAHSGRNRGRRTVQPSRQRLRVQWRPHWRRLAVVAAPKSGADGIDRSIRITKSLLDCLGLLGSGYLGVPARVLPSTPPSPGWKEVPCPTSE